MALLEAHGIGNGKYKIGGTYSANFFRYSVEKPAGQQIAFFATNTGDDSNFQPYCIAKGENNTIYVGGRGGQLTQQLKKMDLQGNVIWGVSFSETSENVVGRIVFSESDGLLLVSVTGLGVYGLNPDGDILYNIPFTHTCLDLFIKEDRFMFGLYNSNETNLRVYDLSGQQTNTYTVPGLQHFNYKDGFFYILSNQSTNNAYKMNTAGVTVWAAQDNHVFTNTNPKGAVMLDGQGHVYFASQDNPTTGNSYTSYMSVRNMETGEIVSKAARSSSGDTLNPNTNTSTNLFTRTQPHLIFGTSGNYFTNNDDYPVIIAYESNQIRVRSINFRQDTYSQFSLPATYSFNINRAYNQCYIDENRVAYIATLTAIFIVDVNSYLTIKN